MLLNNILEKLDNIEFTLEEIFKDRDVSYECIWKYWIGWKFEGMIFKNFVFEKKLNLEQELEQEIWSIIDVMETLLILL